MSSSNLAVSGGINGNTRVVHNLFEEGIANCPVGNQINFFAKEIFQINLQSEETIESIVDSEIVEFDKEVEIASGWIKVALRCRAEYIEPMDIVLSTEREQIGSMLFNQIDHCF
jgi:hypothetical protein